MEGAPPRFRDVGYARISVDQRQQGLGVARQEEDVRATSERTGGNLVAFFTDNDVSASRYSKKARKGYDQVVELVRAGAVDRIVVYDMDRLYRRPRELEDLIDFVESRPGFAVLSVSGSWDLTTADGRHYARGLVNSAAKASDDTSRRIIAQQKQSAAMGRPGASKRAFGYACPHQGPDDCRTPGCDHTSHAVCQLDGCPHDGVSIIPAEAELLREAARDFLAGEAMQAIARRWNDAGIVTPQNHRPWVSTVVRRVLESPRAAGLRVRHRNVVAVGQWEPILDRATHEAILRKLADPDRRRKNPPRRQTFTGILFDHVERPMTLTMTGGASRRWRQYRSVVRVPTSSPGPLVTIAADPVERLVAELLFLEVESGAVAARAAARRQRRPRPTAAGEDPAVLEEELRALAEDHGNGLISRTEWMAARRPLQARLERARAATVEVVEDAVVASIDPALRERWALPVAAGGLSVDRKRAILAAVFERVVIHPAKGRGPTFDPDRVEPIYRA